MTITKNQFKILKRIVSEGYKLKQQHGNPKWRKALEDCEGWMRKEKGIIDWEKGGVYIEPANITS